MSGRLSGADISAAPPTGVPVGAQYVDTDFSPPLLMILQSLNPDTWVASAGGGSTQGAPADAGYWVTGANSRLTGEVVVPTPPGGTTTFLRADTTWGVPAGGGGARESHVEMVSPGTEVTF